MRDWRISRQEWQQAGQLLKTPQSARATKPGRPVALNMKALAQAALYHHFASLAPEYSCFGWNELPSKFRVSAF
jgi:hypothetical protein